MSVTIMVSLFGKPGQELDEGAPVTAEELRGLGRRLHERLDEAASIVEKLCGAGWESQMSLYDIILSHPYLNTTAEVEAKLEELGIDPQQVFIEEWEDEEDFDEEFEGEEGFEGESEFGEEGDEEEDRFKGA
jgi:hypothetical protein